MGTKMIIICPDCNQEFTDSRVFRAHVEKNHDTDFLHFLRTIYYPKYKPEFIENFKCRIEGCNNDALFIKFSKGFSGYCCKEHSNLGRVLSDRKTYREKYGVDHPWKNKEVYKKCQETYRKKTGYDSPLSNPEARKLGEETCLERYGVRNVFASKEIQETMKKTRLEKYGSEYIGGSKEIQEKIKKTMLERYGVENMMQVEEFKAAARETSIEKYGFPCHLSTPEARYNSVKLFKEGKYDSFIEKIKEKDLTPLFDKEYYTEPNSRDFRFRCNRCGCEFTTKYSAAGYIECRECAPIGTSIEIGMEEFLKSLEIEYSIRTRKIIEPFELDFYIESKNLAIEMDGLYWHKSQEPGDTYHLNKTRLCKEKGIRLIHITDSEWENKNDIMKSVIRSALGLSNKIYARNCEIREVSFIDGKNFCEENHINGYGVSSIRIGLYHNSELVQLCTFGKSRFKKGEIELIRHCSKLNTTVVGGFSRIIKYFASKYQPEKLVTYCDLRFFDGHGYINSGWKEIGRTGPNYWYFSYDEFYLHNRIMFQKHKLKDLLEEYDENLTEVENMTMNGWMIYCDCGSLKLEYPL